MPGLEPQQQVNPVVERPHADRLGVQPATKRDHVSLDQGGRCSGHQGDPAQCRPHQVTVETVGRPTGNVVDHIHVGYLGHRLIGRSSRVAACQAAPYLPCFPDFRHTTEAVHAT